MIDRLDFLIRSDRCGVDTLDLGKADSEWHHLDHEKSILAMKFLIWESLQSMVIGIEDSIGIH